MVPHTTFEMDCGAAVVVVGGWVIVPLDATV